MKFGYFFTFICLLFCLETAFGFSAQAEWWKNKSLKEKLTLTKAQIEEMDRIFTQFKKTRIELQGELRKHQVELNNLMSREELKEKKINKEVDELAKTRKKFLAELVKMRLAIRKLLSPDQLKLLLSEYPDIFNLNRRWTGRQRRTIKKGKVILEKGGEEK